MTIFWWNFPSSSFLIMNLILVLSSGSGTLMNLLQCTVLSGKYLDVISYQTLDKRALSRLPGWLVAPTMVILAEISEIISYWNWVNSNKWVIPEIFVINRLVTPLEVPPSVQSSLRARHKLSISSIKIKTCLSSLDKFFAVSKYFFTIFSLSPVYLEKLKENYSSKASFYFLLRK